MRVGSHPLGRMPAQPKDRGRTCINTARQASPIDSRPSTRRQTPGVKLQSRNLLPTGYAGTHCSACTACLDNFYTTVQPESPWQPLLLQSSTNVVEGLCVRAVSLAERTIAQFVSPACLLTINHHPLLADA